MTVTQQLLSWTKTSRLRDRIKHQSELLDIDRKQLEAQSAVLRQSVVHSAVSPLGLSATAVVGFVTGRRLFRKRRQSSQPAADAAPATTTAAAIPTWWWLELLVPVAISWIRETAVAYLRRNRESPPPSPPQ